MDHSDDEYSVSVMQWDDMTPSHRPIPAFLGQLQSNTWLRVKIEAHFALENVDLLNSVDPHFAG